jgi:alanyl-tRNA synthetase
VRIISETSSAANVRRIEALSGPGAIEALREQSAALEAIARLVRADQAGAARAVEALQERLRELERATAHDAAVDAAPLAAAARTVGGVPFVATALADVDAKALPDLADRIQGKLAAPGVVVVASGTNAVVRVDRPLADAVDANALREAFSVAFGGGGGGRATLARAGGGDPARLEDAFEAARAALERIVT